LKLRLHRRSLADLCTQGSASSGGLAGWFHTPKEKSLSPLQWTFTVSPHFSRGWLNTKHQGFCIFLSLYETTLYLRGGWGVNPSRLKSSQLVYTHILHQFEILVLIVDPGYTTALFLCGGSPRIKTRQLLVFNRPLRRQTLREQINLGLTAKVHSSGLKIILWRQLIHPATG
jgi:hypothetical protein